MSPTAFCASPYTYRRRPARTVRVGDPARQGLTLGASHPVALQSMLTADTMDTAACVRQTLDLVAAGCPLVRLTAPTVNDAANLRTLVHALHERNCHVPLVADIHFKPEAALEAARWVDKIRINPGNFADTKKFARREYTPAQYQAELPRLEQRFTPLVRACQTQHRALRIGVNHGSLSDRILNRYGDTPQGMVESALEFARIARQHHFHDLVFSMKASSPKVMIQCYRLLAARLAELGPDWNYPLHLGVTEAGDGEDGRVKSAIGIGALLCDGLGDTLRVSLTEDSTREIPVGRDLLAQIPALTQSTLPVPPLPLSFDPFTFERRLTAEIPLAPEPVPCGGDQPVRVVVTRAAHRLLAPLIGAGDEMRPEAVYEDLDVLEVDPLSDLPPSPHARLVTVKDGVPLPPIAAFRLLAARLKQSGRNNPILLKDRLDSPAPPLPPPIALLRAAVAIGSPLADGIGDAILVRSEADPGASLRLAYTILQAAGCRSFKADYVACPSCGRTLFNLQTVTARIKARTQHLKGVKIAIMGCIVNGPGEMADADFGYVGGAPGKVNLYVGKKAVRFNIPETEAVDHLVDLIRQHGKWIDPEQHALPKSRASTGRSA
ncbi:MAG: (E)-4-hydroxy-3-methylbut-2-enyl-diphosphate synthase [Verrucomicrobia bacterium]|nr:(E)-4-hydroxy-3-methylbut-2-enyl-diphosphate synthase [Verrucomicrobiota bacterium]